MSTQEHQARKRFGQNFLQDKHIIQKIIAAINPTAAQNLVEIGPGLGAITDLLLEKVTHLNVVEIDRDLIAKLKTRQLPTSKLSIYDADALQFDFASLGSDLRIVGNLPYNISTPLLFHLLTFIININDMHFMLQKEVVERICAAADTANYGRLSVMLQYYCQCQHLFNVPASAFKPAPKVESAIIRLTPYIEKPYLANDEILFAKIVKAAFTHRRKTIFNNLKSFITAEALQNLNINPKLRPENLSVAAYVAITNMINE